MNEAFWFQSPCSINSNIREGKKWLLGHKGVTGDQPGFFKGKVPDIHTQITRIIKLRQCAYLEQVS